MEKLTRHSIQWFYNLLEKGECEILDIEAIIRYLDTAEDIDNEGARILLMLGDNDIYYISRLFAEMKENNLIRELRKDNRKTWYERVKTV